MNNVTVHFLEMRGFGSYGNPTKIVFDQHTLTLIRGHNASGKSTQADALMFALYGVAYRANARKDDMVTAHSRSEAFVAVELTTMGRRYRVERTIRPNTFKVWCDGERIWADMKNIKDVEKRFQVEVLKMTKNSFMALSMQSRDNNFQFPTMSPRERRDLVENVLGLKEMALVQDHFKGKSKEFGIQIDRMDRLADKHRNEIRLIGEHNTKLNQDFEALKDEKRKSIEEKKAKIQVHKDKIAAHQLLVAATKKRVAYFPSIDKEVNVTKGEVHDAKKAIQDAKAMLAFYEANSNCPTCSQPITEKFKQDAKADLAAKIDTADADIKRLSVVETAQNEHGETRKELLETIKSEEAEVRTSTIQISMIGQAIAELETAIVEFDNMERQDPAPVEELLKKCEKNLAVLHMHKDDYDQLIEMFSEKVGRARVLGQYLPFINKTVNDFATKLGSVYQIELLGNCELKVYQSHIERPYYMCSSGEQWRISTAFMWTWRALAEILASASINIVYQDEIIDGSLDAQGMDDYMRFLRLHLKNDNVLIISHNPIMWSQTFDRVLMVEKLHNNSRIVEA